MTVLLVFRPRLIRSIHLQLLNQLPHPEYHSQDQLVLSRGVLEELSKPNFKISCPDSFGQAISTTLPILVFGHDGITYCRYDKENTTPLTEKAVAAQVMLEAQLKEESLKQYMNYQQGDLLLIKNQRVVHSREGFQSRDDGADRWLMRLFGMSSLERIIQQNPDTKHIGKD